jgi:serine/threonine-protein kinase
MVVTDLLAKNPEDRPPNALAVAIRLGLADHEITGLAIGLARMVYGEDEQPDEDVRPLSRALLDPAPTVADGQVGDPVVDAADD